jgi:glycosyltransferase involved in cell wall biosynthesis
MRILMISALYPPVLSGVANHVAEVCSILVRTGHEVTCLCGSGLDADTTLSDGLRIERRRLLLPAALTDRVAGSAAFAAVERHIPDTIDDYDLIHCHNAHLYGGAIAGLAFSQAGRLPLINTVHDHFGEGMRADVLQQPWERLIYVSDFVRARLPSQRPAVTLHLGIDLKRFTQDGPRDPRLMSLERPVIYHPARLLPWKGADVGLAAFIRVRERLGSGTLVLTNSDSAGVETSVPAELKRKLQEMAARAGISDRIVFIDVEHAGLPSAMRACDLVWYPTTGEEPYGLTPLEAMACGVPVIVTDSGGMAEVSMPGLTGLVVPRGDRDALASAAYSLLVSKARREHVIQAALRYIKNFSLDLYVKRLIAIYAASAAF